MSLLLLTLGLASTLEIESGGTRPPSEVDTSSYNLRSVVTIAFQFTFENHLRDNVAAMARQYVPSVVGSVQTLTLAQWVYRMYRIKDINLILYLSFGLNFSNPLNTVSDLFQVDAQGGDALLKQLWHYSDAIMCCSLKTNASPVFTFANQAGLDMLETTLVALQDIILDKILDEAGRKILCSEFSQIMQQGFAYRPAGICVFSMGRPVSYKRAVAWKVLNDDEFNHTTWPLCS
ncbi:Homeobox-leucine zipper protein ATHB-14 [Turnera subulata]|uniref:Homeobox-leucine zipper protein ATHB-14 n=1 Tax=Turnera subulata TaxID=218843 RepID=A0A9Q0FWF9_9ROSI|nr:Homeobox-leucine zipper protein ATHB-14 [Turnera subulata]